jgi:hypothetical protein
MTDAEIVENLVNTRGRPRNRHLFHRGGMKRILSFDGGGVRGVISVAFLERIEEIFSAYQRKLLTAYLTENERKGVGDAKVGATVSAARKKLNDKFRLADWFDLVGGTSTGALIAGALALGINSEQIKAFYTEKAGRIFKPPRWRVPGVQAKFDAGPLRREIDAIVGQRTLDSNDLLTGLCVVTKRMDTGSPWILSNNPRAPYWNSKPASTKNGGYIGNRDYKLASLVRASTAAPHFFDPEIVQIIGNQVGTRVSPETHGMFVDGGVTPFNNPSIALLMQVVLKAYKIRWDLGPDKLQFVSIGTGSYRSKLTFAELGMAKSLKLAVNSLLSMMGDTQNMALAQMQWLGECPDPWIINSEIGDLSKETPPGHRWFRFMRYDIRLEQDWIKNKLKTDIPDRFVADYRRMDDPAIIEPLYNLAKIAAKEQVKPEHFFPKKARTLHPQKNPVADERACSPGSPPYPPRSVLQPPMTGP